jgi:hypothetical protein
LFEVRQLGASSVAQQIAALRFFMSRPFVRVGAWKTRPTPRDQPTCR